MRLHTPFALYNMGHMQKPDIALKETVDNGIDACEYEGVEKPAIWVAVYRDRIEITDNGSGILPIMTDRDSKILDDYFERLQKQEVTVADVRDNVSEAARHSLPWLSGCVSFSPKQQGKENTLGVRGIGALAHLTYGRRAYAITKPSQKLVGKFQKAGGKLTYSQTYAMNLPKVSIYSEWDISAVATISDEELTDPFGKPLPHGTKVVVTDFTEPDITSGKHGALTEGRIYGMLASTISADHISISTGDLVKKSGAKAWRRVGREIVQGTPVYSGGMRTPDHAEFYLRLFYDPLKETNSPSVMRVAGRTEVRTFKLTEIPELNHSPWNKLGGEISFPSYLSDAPLWNSQKDGLEETTQKRSWVSRLISIETVVKQKLKEAQRVHTEKTNREFVQDLMESTRIAITQIDVFGGIRNPNVVESGKEPKQSVDDRAKTVRPGVRARVIDENGDGQFDAVIQVLTSGYKRIGSQTTDINGRANFGVNDFPYGRYVIRVVAPYGVTVRQPTDYHFELSRELPGFDAVFKFGVPNGQEARPRTRARILEPTFTSFETNLPYRLNMDQGLIEINLAHPAFNTALMNADETTQIVLLSEYMSAGQALVLNYTDPVDVVQVASTLFGLLYPVFSKKRLDRKSERRGDKMKRNRRH